MLEIVERWVLRGTFRLMPLMRQVRSKPAMIPQMVSRIFETHRLVSLMLGHSLLPPQQSSEKPRSARLRQILAMLELPKLLQLDRHFGRKQAKQAKNLPQ
jgi:hypothetical protein